MIELVVRNGCNAVAYDSRAHGASGGKYMSYGVREKDDVTAVLNRVEAQFKNAGPFGILGISYGGAVTTQALGQEPRLRCGVIIISFCRLEDAARVQMRLMTGCCKLVEGSTPSQPTTFAQFCGGGVLALFLIASARFWSGSASFGWSIFV